ncbi:caspase-6-like [Ptychodera flava]|uniref:caspase-6-like n=1 Tax=Ptychodera flava TaxID=63121 RepID=UPI00396A4042
MRYNMNHTRRGLALIFNHEKFDWCFGQKRRVGTKVDADKLSERLKELGFEVNLHDDLTVVGVREVIKRASRADHSDCDAFVCVFLSHGDDGKIYAYDGVNNVRFLIDHFKGDRCPTLVGKPKLFFIQACRGNRHEIGVDVPDGPEILPDEPPIRPTFPAGADFFVAYSVTKGYFSHRDINHGSWFVQALCHILKMYGGELELCELMTLVSRMVSHRQVEGSNRPEMVGNKQLPCFVSMLTKKLYFPRKPLHQHPSESS